MITRTVLLLALLLGLVLPMSAQTANSGAEADAVLQKVRQLDLLNQILPVLMTKEQIRKILPAIEKARQADKDLKAKELEILKKLEPKLDAEIKDGKEKSEVPSTEIVREIVATFQALTLSRQMLVAEQTEAVFNVVKETLNEGQRSAAAKSLDPQISNPGADISTLTEDQRLRSWVTLILMDPLAYDLLLDLSR